VVLKLKVPLAPSCRTDGAVEALEALVVAAQQQDCLTVGVYESAKLMNV